MQAPPPTKDYTPPNARAGISMIFQDQLENRYAVSGEGNVASYNGFSKRLFAAFALSVDTYIKCIFGAERENFIFYFFADLP